MSSKLIADKTVGGNDTNNVEVSDTGIKLKGTAKIIKPDTDSETAVVFTKADGTTTILKVDTTNGLVVVGDYITLESNPTTKCLEINVNFPA